MNKKAKEVEPSVKNFKNFLYLAWQHLNLPNPTPIQYDIADYLQNGSKRIVIEAFRGVGKSWITSAFVCHQLLLNPQRNILVVSASKNRADDFSTFTQRLISEMPLLHHLKPRDDQRHSKVSFDVAPARASHAPSVKSLGVTSQLTGSRADLIIADDVESANNSQTQLMRDRLGETVKEFDAIIKPEVGRIVFLGTPQTEMSLYNDLEERGFETNLVELLDELNGQTYDPIFEHNEFRVETQPMNYRQFTDVALKTFEEQRILRIVDDENLSEVEKLSQFNETFTRLTDMNLTSVYSSVVSITVGDQTVTDKNHIMEFLQNAPVEFYKALLDHVDNQRKKFTVKPRKIITTEEDRAAGAPETLEVPINFDAANFFV